MVHNIQHTQLASTNHTLYLQCQSTTSSVQWLYTAQRPHLQSRWVGLDLCARARYGMIDRFLLGGMLTLVVSTLLLAFLVYAVFVLFWNKNEEEDTDINNFIVDAGEGECVRSHACSQLVLRFLPRSQLSNHNYKPDVGTFPANHVSCLELVPGYQ